MLSGDAERGKEHFFYLTAAKGQEKMPVQKGGNYLGDSPGGGPKDNQMTLYSDAENGHHNGQGNPTSGVGVDRVVSMRRLWHEVDAKAARKKLAGGFLRYLVFIGLYLIVIHFQKSAEPSFYLTDAVSDALLCPISV